MSDPALCGRRVDLPIFVKNESPAVMSVCKRCGAEFTCAMADGGDGGPCWCTAVPPAAPVPAADTGLTCWCPACLKLHLAAKNKPSPESPCT